MNQHRHDPSIENEPHMQGGVFRPDPSEADAQRRIAAAADAQTDDDRVEHSVWEEPGVSHELAGRPSGEDLTYAGWLTRRMAETSTLHSWAVTLAVAASAGVCGIGGAFLGGGASLSGVVLLTVIGPLTEEVMKIAVAFWVVEKRPFLFKSGVQIILCAMAGGVAFAVLENLIYLNLYIPDPSEAIVRWRWTVCVVLHTGCSTLAGVGLMRIWSGTIVQKARPQFSLGAPLLVTAVVVHALYNTSVLLLHLSGFHF